MDNVFSLTMVLLAKSSKNGKYCLAGIDLEAESHGRYPLIRLISNDISSDYAVDNSFFCGNVNVLDLIYVNDLVYKPSNIQVENYLLTKRQSIKKIGSADKNFISSYLKNIYEKRFCQDTIFLDSKEFLYPNIVENQVRHSIELHYVTNLQTVILDYPNYGKQKTKANFFINKNQFLNISVTDPNFYGNTEKIDRACILVSIPNKPFNGKYYKYVSGIHPY